MSNILLRVYAMILIDEQGLSCYTKYVKLTNPDRWIEVVSVNRPCFFSYG